MRVQEATKRRKLMEMQRLTVLGYLLFLKFTVLLLKENCFTTALFCD